MINLFINYLEQISQKTYGDIYLRPVTFPGYVFTSNPGNKTGIQLALSKETRAGIKEFIASGKAGKPNRTTHHPMPFSGKSHFNRCLIFSHATNQSTIGISLHPSFAVCPIILVSQAWTFCKISLLQLNY